MVQPAGRSERDALHDWIDTRCYLTATTAATKTASDERTYHDRSVHVYELERFVLLMTRAVRVEPLVCMGQFLARIWYCRLGPSDLCPASARRYRPSNARLIAHLCSRLNLSPVS